MENRRHTSGALMLDHAADYFPRHAGRGAVVQRAFLGVGQGLLDQLVANAH